MMALQNGCFKIVQRREIMKLATSTGNFRWYVDTVPEEVKCFKESSFKNINLEITEPAPCFSSENEEN